MISFFGTPGSAPSFETAYPEYAKANDPGIIPSEVVHRKVKDFIFVTPAKRFMRKNGNTGMRRSVIR